MATGWSGDGAVQEQIESTIMDAVAKARNELPSGDSLSHCAECGELISEARQKALPEVRFCITCQQALDNMNHPFSDYNRRGSKDSQLR